MEHYLEEVIFLEYVCENMCLRDDIVKERIPLEIWQGLLTLNGFILEDVPVNMKTKDLCLIALTSEGYALQYVPKDLVTYEMCVQAVKTEPMALSEVPNEFITLDLCRNAVASEIQASNFVPNSIQNELHLEYLKELENRT